MFCALAHIGNKYYCALSSTNVSMSTMPALVGVLSNVCRGHHVTNVEKYKTAAAALVQCDNN